MVSGTNSDSTEYDQSDAAVIASWSREHNNGDETHVAVIDASANYYTAVASDIDADGEPVASHFIDTTHTAAEAKASALRWMEENPKGIKLGGGLGGLLG